MEIMKKRESYGGRRGKGGNIRCSLLTLLVISSFCLTWVESQSVTTNPCTGTLVMYCDCGDNAENVSEIDLAKCGIHGQAQESSPDWDVISQMTGVQYLEFSVRLSRLLRFFIPSRVFHGMSRLTYFNLKHGAVDRIPTFAFDNSSSLSEVALEMNEIVFLDRFAFANMESLHTISLKDNQILEINRSVFANLPRLQKLYLERNRIRVIHDFAFADLTSLEELDIKWNNLTVITPDAFRNLKSLRRLDLQSNSIELLGENVFSEMPMLEELELMKNSIMHVNSLAFQGLHRLGRLSLKENKIVELRHSTFTSLRSLYFLDLRQNALETLEEDLIAPIYNNLRNVSFQFLIQGNRFVCDCRILWIQELFNETESTYMQSHLKALECNFFQRHSGHPTSRRRKGHGGHHHHHHLEHSTMDSLSYNSNLTMVAVAPEETTAPLADFDSTRKVLDLDPKELDCHEEKVTTLISVSTHRPPTASSSSSSSSSLDSVSSQGGSGDYPVLIKKSKHNKNLREQDVLADTPDLNPSQSSRSAAAAAAAAPASASTIQVISHHYVTWLKVAVAALFVMSLTT